MNKCDNGHLPGAHVPTEDEQANAPYYADKVERLLEECDGSTLLLAQILCTIAEERKMKSWSEGVSHARRSVTGLLEGKSSLEWVYDIIDAAYEEFC